MRTSTQKSARREQCIPLLVPLCDCNRRERVPIRWTSSISRVRRHRVVVCDLLNINRIITKNRHRAIRLQYLCRRRSPLTIIRKRQTTYRSPCIINQHRRLHPHNNMLRRPILLPRLHRPIRFIKRRPSRKQLPLHIRSRL